HRAPQGPNHEVEMDVNEVVEHHRRGSLDSGVTPSDPNSIQSVFNSIE
ncbi:unnamed protein product, partial [Discosporangium mesarthrocarpum]